MATPIPVPYRCDDGIEVIGPTAGYQYHRSLGQEPCLACRLAYDQYHVDRRQAPRRRQVLLEALAGFDKYPTGRRGAA